MLFDEQTSLRLEPDAKPEGFASDKLTLDNFDPEAVEEVERQRAIEEAVSQVPTPKGTPPRLEKPMSWDEVESQPEWWAIGNTKRKEVLGSWSKQMLDFMRTQEGYDEATTPKLMQEFVAEQDKRIRVTAFDRLKNAVAAFTKGAASDPAETMKFVGIASYYSEKWADKHGLSVLTAEREGKGVPDQVLEDFATYQYGKAIDELAQKVAPGDPRVQQEFIAEMVPKALGQASAFIVTGGWIRGGVRKLAAKLGMGEAASATGVATMKGAVMSAPQGHEDAVRHGATDEEAFKSFVANFAVGTSEALPAARWIQRFDKGSGGTLRRAFWQGGEEALEEAMQEFGQTVAGNKIAQEIYDEDREVLEGAGVSAGAGGVSGGVMGFLTSLLPGRQHVGRVTQSAQSEAGKPVPTTPESADQPQAVDLGDYREKSEAWRKANPKDAEVLDSIMAQLPEGESRRFVARRVEAGPETKPAAPVKKPRKVAVKPLYRGTTIDQWNAIQRGETPQSEFSTGDQTWVTTSRESAEAYANRDTENGVVIEYKPAAHERVRRVTDDPGDHRRQGKLTVDDVQRVTDAKGNVIYEAQQGPEPAPEPTLAATATQQPQSLRLAPVEEGAEVAPRAEAVQGRETQASGADPNVKFDFQFEVVPSHTDAMAPNPAFEGGAQPRDRGRVASEMQIDEMAKSLNPDAILRDVGALDRGPPIVGPDYKVDSGNGRILAMRRARALYPEKWAAFQAELRAKAPDYGIDPALVEGMADAVLVRKRKTSVDRQAFADEANASTALRMSPFEQAFTDARRLGDRTVAELVVGEGQTIEASLLSRENRPILQEFVSNLSTTERAELLDENGQINLPGLNRIKQAIFVKTFPGEAGRRLTQTFFESTDPDLKNVEAGIFGALSALAKSEGLVRAGQREAALGIGEDLAAAADKLASLRRRGEKVSTYLDQGVLGGRELTPFQERLLRFLDENARSSKRVREFLNRYATGVAAQSETGQEELLGMAKPTKDDLVKTALKPAPEMAQGDLLRERPAPYNVAPSDVKRYLQLEAKRQDGQRLTRDEEQELLSVEQRLGQRTLFDMESVRMNPPAKPGEQMGLLEGPAGYDPAAAKKSSTTGSGEPERSAAVASLTEASEATPSTNLTAEATEPSGSTSILKSAPLKLRYTTMDGNPRTILAKSEAELDGVDLAELSKLQREIFGRMKAAGVDEGKFVQHHSMKDPTRKLRRMALAVRDGELTAAEAADEYLADVNNGSAGFLAEAPAGYGGAVADPFYSQLRQAVESIPQEKMTVEQLRAMLPKLGVKAEEIEWTGLEAFLEGKTSVTKAEVLAAIQPVKIEEVVKGASALDAEAQAKNAREIVDVDNRLRTMVENARRAGYSVGADSLSDVPGDVMIRRLSDNTLMEIADLPNEVSDLVGAISDDFRTLHELSRGPANLETKFGTYTLPGGKNYRELLLTLPFEQAAPVRATYDELMKRDPATARRVREQVEIYADHALTLQELDNEVNNVFYRGSDRQILDADTINVIHAVFPEVEEYAAKPRAGPFRSSHFSELNILAHVRFNERTDATGAKVLFVEEIQSDWHQKGRDTGYANLAEVEAKRAKDIAELNERIDRLKPKLETYADELKTATGARQIQVMDAYKGVRDEIMETVRRRDHLESIKGSYPARLVPHAPFKKSWPELAMKRMIRWAAENGFDRVAWTQGEQQAERYNLSNYVDKIEWQKNRDGTYDVIITEKGASRPSEALSRGSQDAQELSNLVGKDIARRILESAEQSGMIKEEGLKVGGEGMKGFYDKMLVDVANKLGKRFGAKVGETSFSTGNFEGETPRIWEESPGRWAYALSDGTQESGLPNFEAAQRAAADFGAGGAIGGDVLVHSLNITPAMRQSVMQQGQALFEKPADYRGIEPEQAEGIANRIDLENPATWGLTPEQVVAAEEWKQAAEDPDVFDERAAQAYQALWKQAADRKARLLRVADMVRKGQSGVGIDQAAIRRYISTQEIPHEKLADAETQIAYVLEAGKDSQLQFPYEQAAGTETAKGDVPGAGRANLPGVAAARQRAATLTGFIKSPEALVAALEEGGGSVSAIFEKLVTTTQKIMAFDPVGAVLKTPADAGTLMRAIRNPYFESMWALALNARGKVVGAELVSVGTLNSSLADPRRIMRLMSRVREQTSARQVILVHNHPSGNPMPSSDDFKATSYVTDALRDAGIEVTDHLVLNGDKFYSFRAQGFEKYKMPGRPDWELVARETLVSVEVGGPDAVMPFVKALRAADPSAFAVVYLTTKSTVTAVEKMPVPGTIEQVIEAVKLGAGREGAAAVVVSWPSNMEQAKAVQWSMQLRKSLAGDGMKLHDAFARTNSISPVESLRALGIMAEATAGYGEGMGFDQLNAELARINAQIEGHHARGETPPRELLSRKGDLISYLNDLTPENGAGVPAMTEGNRTEAVTVPEADPETERKFLALNASTFAPEPAVSRWWRNIKRLFTGFASQAPSVPIRGKEADLGRGFHVGLRHLKGATERAMFQAQQQVSGILEPLVALNVDMDPNLVTKMQALQERIAKAQEKGEPVPDKVLEGWRELRAQALSNPFHAFRLAVIYRDLWFRSKMQAGTNPDGGPRLVKLPFNLSTAEVEAELSRIHNAIATSEHRAAIEEALKRHYALTAKIKQGLLDRGFVIPEEMSNPLYYPHFVLDYFTGKLEGTRITTADDFRGYLQDLTGSEKPIEMDYLAAMYKHVADVFGHNLRQDITEEFWARYNIKDNLKQRAQASARRQNRVANDWEWRALIPEGYREVTVDPYIPLRQEFFVDRKRLSERLGVELNDGNLQRQLKELGVELTAEDLIESLAAGEKQTWVVPEAIADALNQLNRESQAGLAGPQAADPARWLPALGRTLSTAWKWIKLFGPFSWARYNFNNLTTDLAKMSAGDPRWFGYLPRAAYEVWQYRMSGKPPNEAFQQALLYGALDSFAMKEAGMIRDVPGFEKFQTRWKRAQWWIKSVATLGAPQFSEFREHTFRYAKYLADLERLERGEVPVYMGAYWKNVEAEPNNFAKAARISRDTFVDYDDISTNGQLVRDYLQPFYAWTEGNFKAEINTLRNLKDLGAQRVPGGAGSIAARRIAGFALRLGFGYTILGIFNAMMRAKYDLDDEELSDEDRRRQYVVMGRDEAGNPQIVYFATAYGDILKWIGGNQLFRNGMDYLRGKQTLEQASTSWFHELPGDTFNNLWQGVYPWPKAMLQAFGVETFPDIRNPRPIRAGGDRAHAIFAAMTDQDTAAILRRMYDPDYYAPDVGKRMQQVILQVRTRDPEQFAFYDMREKVREFIVSKGGAPAEGFGTADLTMTRAASNFRVAIYRGDVDAALRWYQRLNELGYTREQFESALRVQDPLQGLRKGVHDGRNWRKEFVESLSERDQRKLDRAYAYWARLAPGGRKGIRSEARGLFPSRRSPAEFQEGFRDSPERLDALKESLRQSALARSREDRLERAMEEKALSLQPAR